MSKAVELRKQILDLVDQYYREKFREKTFDPSCDLVHYAGRVFDEEELINLVDASLDFYLTASRYAEAFETNFADYLGVSNALLVNSGSSANLVALTALTSPKLDSRRLLPGDEVLTVAAAFPTTVAPILQNQLVPVFVDVNLGDYTAMPERLAAAIGPKTKAIMMAHTMGVPFQLDAVIELVKKHNLWLIEDNCDALGSRYQGKLTGAFGHLATFSFYPAHHITMGEGGAVYTNNRELIRIVNSFRDWGRDCQCAPGQDNLCGKRFMQQFGELPFGYDHKYVYSHFGFNMKATDMQAAIGCAQLEKLPVFTEARKRNWKFLYDNLADLHHYFILPEPTPKSDPSWFGFMLSVKSGVDISRDSLVDYLESKGIQTRMLFAGNLIKQPCFNELRKKKEGYRVVGDLKNTNLIMSQTFWIGVYPGLRQVQLDFMVKCIRDYILDLAPEVGHEV